MSPTHSVEHLLEQAGWIRRLARSLVGDPNLADDLCQETWARALEHPPAADRPLRGWLATVMRNALRQRLRGEGRRREHEHAAGTRVASTEERSGERPGEPVEAASSADEPVDAIVGRAALHKDLVEELMALDEPFRTTLLLRYFEELMPRAIATRAGVPLATVKSRLTRGLEKLRERLDRRAHGDRGRWMAALAPLAWPGIVPAPLSPAALSTSGAASSAAPAALSPAWSAISIGASLVNLKLLVSLLVVGALAVAAFTLLPEEPTAAPRSGARVADVAPAPLEPVADALVPATAVRGEPRAASTRDAIEPPPAPAPAEVSAPVAAPATSYTVQGRVLDVASNPLPGVEVVLEDGAATSTAPGDVRARAQSESGGRFELVTDRRGGRVIVRDERWATVLAGAFASENVVVVVAPRIDLAGRVVDGAGRGLAQAVLRLALPQTLRASLGTVLDHSEDLAFETRSDADGRFDLAGVPAVAGAKLAVQLDGYLPHEEDAPLQTLRDLVVVLATPEAGPRVLRGRVVDAAGAPIEGALVSHGLDTHETPEDGTFEFDLDAEHSFSRAFNELALRYIGPEAVQPESDVLVALRPGYLPRSAHARGRTSEGVPIWPDQVVIVLEGEPLAIEGVVLGPTGAGLAGARVWIADPTLFGGLGDPTAGEPTLLHAETLLVGGERGWNSVASDGDGHFRIEGLLAREYTLCAMDERTLQRVEATGVQAGTDDVELVLDADGVYGTLRGRVLSLGGEPIAGVSVHGMCDAFRLKVGGAVISTHHAGSDAVLTDEEGRFELVDVPKDLVYLRLDCDRSIPLEWGRHVEGGLAKLVGERPEAVEIRLSLRCHFQVELDDPARADRLEVLDGEGNALEISEFRGSSRQEGPSAALVQGRSAVLAVGEEARTLVLHADGREVERVAIELSPHEQRTIRP